jgi:hypothetical protein
MHWIGRLGSIFAQCGDLASTKGSELQRARKAIRLPADIAFARTGFQANLPLVSEVGGAIVRRANAASDFGQAAS